MYAKVLVTLENSPSDRAIIEHIKLLAPLCGSTLTLLHVATSVPAQIHRHDASGEEITEDLAYLQSVEAELQRAGIPTKAELTYGDP
ncbi:MAG: universal stress protein, partial [Rhodanobacteraceae bacterium]